MSAPILAFATSLRNGSFNNKLVAAFAASMAEVGLETEILDLTEYELPLYHGDLDASERFPENARRLYAAMSNRQSIFLASPEYNAAPAPLTLNLLAWVSRAGPTGGAPAVFGRTTFALGSASPGGFGGYRGLMALRQTLELGLGARVLPQMVSIGMAAAAFDAQGRVTDQRSLAMLAAQRAALQQAIAFD